MNHFTQEEPHRLLPILLKMELQGWVQALLGNQNEKIHLMSLFHEEIIYFAGACYYGIFFCKTRFYKDFKD